eukprot:scaffold1229_cov60-Phaeocystis_antarctica.AAC.5
MQRHSSRNSRARAPARPMGAARSRSKAPTPGSCAPHDTRSPGARRAIAAAASRAPRASRLATARGCGGRSPGAARRSAPAAGRAAGSRAHRAVAAARQDADRVQAEAKHPVACPALAEVAHAGGRLRHEELDGRAAEYDARAAVSKEPAVLQPQPSAAAAGDHVRVSQVQRLRGV